MTALLTRGNENVVAVLDKDVVRFRTVKVASTDGAIVSLLGRAEAGREDRDQCAGRSDERQPHPADRGEDALAVATLTTHQRPPVVPGAPVCRFGPS